MTFGNDSPQWVTLLAMALEAVEVEGDPGLERVCAAHPDHADRLRAEVRQLRSAGLAGTVGDERRETATGTLPERIGPYTLVRSLGAGGMGEVYLAEQQEPIRRQVALKVIRRGGASPGLLARFQAERQALSRMQHEGIARVYDAGATPDGTPYLTMEYVADARTLTAYCSEHRLDVRARVEICARICDALRHAHQRGILHRDLKPGNILVTTQEGRPMPKVIDFGLAKALDEELPGGLVTQTGQVVGTPEYMSPEQASADPRGLDTRTDVYSLGVVLYELLCGTRPFMVDPRDPSGLVGLLRRIAEEEPTAPGVRLLRRQVPDDFIQGTGEQTSTALWRGVRGDLDWIALRALQKDREQRYAGVSELAADLRRHLDGLPVLAGPPSFTYVFRKFVRRHRTGVTAATGALVLLVALLVQQLRGLRLLAERDSRLQKAGLAQVLRSLRREAEEQLLPVAPGTCQPAAALRDWLQRTEAVCAEAETRRADLAALRNAGTRIAGEEHQFADPRDQILHDSLVAMLAERTALLRPGEVLERVRRHVPWAEAVERVTLDEAAAAWQSAIASIADPKQCLAYGGLPIAPQLGLVPLRRNPQSGLWEFRFWTPGGAAPEFGEDGRVANLDACDPVFVLVPGGRCWIGSQKADRRQPCFFVNTPPVESPAHQVALDPFFVSKYELTQAQWTRWTGVNPSAHQPPKRPLAGRPVESVSWPTCDRELRSWGLLLPTEAQWEHAARGARTDPWWTGTTRLSLDGQINLADRAAEEQGVPALAFEDLFDAWPLVAPVDALAPNPFGLHHALGNVQEWCRDPHCSQYPGTDEPGHAPGDGLLSADGDNPQRPVRGGSYLSTAVFVRASNRIHRPPLSASAELGVRPARPMVQVRP